MAIASNDNPIMMEPFKIGIPKETPAGSKEKTAPGLQSYSFLQFYNVALREGFARSYLFRVKNISNVPLGDALIYVTSGKIPDRKINTATVNYQSYSFRVPMNADYPDKENWQLNFYCDKNYFIRGILEEWSKNIYNPDTFSTKKEFTAYDLEMVLLEPTETELKEKRIYRLIGCIPTLISTPQYNIKTSGEIMTVNASLAFQYVETADVKTAAKPLTFIDKINKFAKGVKNITGQVKEITGAVNSVATATTTLRTATRTLRNNRR
jgi:hypothetical protein